MNIKRINFIFNTDLIDWPQNLLSFVMCVKKPAFAVVKA